MIAKETINVVINIIIVMLEECPTQILLLASYNSVNNNFDYVNDINTANSNDYLNTVISKDFLSFIQMILNLLLHGLYGNQCVDSFIKLFDCIILVIKRFGFRLFLYAVGDSLQVSGGMWDVLL